MRFPEKEMPTVAVTHRLKNPKNRDWCRLPRR